MKFVVSRSLLLAFVFSVSLAFSVNGATVPRPPNVIFILADDLGIGDVSCYGADNRNTPHIDKLANTGMRFTRAFTAPLCGPSRACIMTGRYAFRTGATNQDSTARMKVGEEVFTPAVLKPAGYVSSMIGKWGQLPGKPSDFGFEDSLRFRGSGVYWGTNEKGKKDSYEVNGKEFALGKEDYMPDLMHAHLVRFITQHQADPFFVYYSLSGVHGEIVRTPDSKPGSTDLFAENCAYMDKLVGKLVEELERLKLREKTLLIFVGDNGTAKSPSAQSTIGGRRLVGQKGEMTEGGALVPLVVNWPGVTPEGKVSADMIDSTDFLPTLAEVAGVTIEHQKIIDGRSFAPQLRGEKGTPREWVFIELARNWYVRESGWKLNQAGKLFDMSGAPFEEREAEAGREDAAGLEARMRLQGVLDSLNPGAGILDDGDGSGRHGSKRKNK